MVKAETNLISLLSVLVMILWFKYCHTDIIFLEVALRTMDLFWNSAIFCNSHTFFLYLSHVPSRSPKELDQMMGRAQFEGPKTFLNGK